MRNDEGRVPGEIRLVYIFNEEIYLKNVTLCDMNMGSRVLFSLRIHKLDPPAKIFDSMKV